ncbi:hypothetical protein DUI87_06652 [Hirundo rustica rustica]|uniref:Uncharacterized protein n=1 Tax=Hirundo rustica rustica TaxID=333673 RepID=A0A3M0KT80_HIRRU|nr:hypothetical protein DUI87_06652 [Hirundo rustica rustica]
MKKKKMKKMKKERKKREEEEMKKEEEEDEEDEEDEGLGQDPKPSILTHYILKPQNLSFQNSSTPWAVLKNRAVKTCLQELA